MWNRMTPDQATSRRAMCGVPALLAAALAALSITAATVRAEPAAASGTPDTCLDKPNAVTPQGSRWFYRIDHASGRHCWHLRDQGANAGAARIAPHTTVAQAVPSNAPAPTPLMPSDRPASNHARRRRRWREYDGRRGARADPADGLAERAATFRGGHAGPQRGRPGYRGFGHARTAGRAAPDRSRCPVGETQCCATGNRRTARRRHHRAAASAGPARGRAGARYHRHRVAGGELDHLAG